MAGNVDNPDPVIAQFQMGEANVDGYTACFFFLEPVGVDSGQCPNQRCLAVIDVTGCSNYYILHDPPDLSSYSRSPCCSFSRQASVSGGEESKPFSSVFICM